MTINQRNRLVLGMVVFSIVACLLYLCLFKNNKGGLDGGLGDRNLKTNDQNGVLKTSISQVGFPRNNYFSNGSQNVKLLDGVSSLERVDGGVDRYFENVKTFQQIELAIETVAKHNPKGSEQLLEMLVKMTNVQAFVIAKMKSPNARLWRSVKSTSDGEYRDGSVAVDLKMRDSEMVPWNVDVRVEGGWAFSVVYNRDGFVERFGCKTIDGVSSWSVEFHPSGGVKSFVYSKMDLENKVLIDKALFMVSEDGSNLEDLGEF